MCEIEALSGSFERLGTLSFGVSLAVLLSGEEEYSFLGIGKVRIGLRSPGGVISSIERFFMVVFS